MISDIKKWINVTDISPFREGYLVTCKAQYFYLNKHFDLIQIDFANYDAVFVENETSILAGSKLGLHRLRFQDNRSLKIVDEVTFTKQNTNGRLGGDFVKSIFKDKHGIIWLGTSGGGVTKLIKQINTFKLFHDGLESDNLKNNNINCFF